MRKKMLLSALIIISVAIPQMVFATFNKTYFTSILGAYDRSSAIDIIDAGNGNALVLGSTNSEPILLRLIDFNGNVLAEQAFDVPGAPTIYPTQVIQTPTNDYIVVGYCGANPFAAYFNGISLANMWFNVYNSNAASPPGNFSGIGSRVNVVFMSDLPGMHYMLSCSGDNQGTIGYSGDAVLNVLCIDGISGAQVWNNKYVINGRNSFYNYITDLRDFSHALTYVHDPLNSKYFIGGTTDQWYDPSVWYLYGFNRTMGFALTVDNTGAVVDPYREFTVPSYCFGQDAIWDDDPLTQSIVMSYTFGNTGIGSPNNASLLAITKFDVNLNVTQTLCYSLYNATENYAYSIKRTAANDGYIVSCRLVDGLTYSPTMVDDAGILKVNKVGNALFLNRFNVFHTTLPGAIISHVDPITLAENYVLESTTDFGSTTSQDIRIISTDVSGKECGFEDSGASIVNYNISPVTYAYSPTPVGSIYAMGLNAPTTSSALSDCNAGFVAPPYYRQGHPASIAQKSDGMNIYPTLLSSGENLVQFDFYAGSDATLTVKLYTIEGRLLGTQSLHAEQGNNKLSWNIPAMIPGSYLIVAESPELKQYKTAQITKL